MEQIPKDVIEIATMSNGLQVWKIPNKEVGGFIYYSEENGAPLPELVEALISIECLEIILNDMKKTQGLASPCALCEGKEKEIAELKEQYSIMDGRRERAIKSLEESEKQFGELQEAYNKLIGS